MSILFQYLAPRLPDSLRPNHLWQIQIVRHFLRRLPVDAGMARLRLAGCKQRCGLWRKKGPGRGGGAQALGSGRRLLRSASHYWEAPMQDSTASNCAAKQSTNFKTVSPSCA